MNPDQPIPYVLGPAAEEHTDVDLAGRIRADLAAVALELDVEDLAIIEALARRRAGSARMVAQ